MGFLFTFLWKVLTSHLDKVDSLMLNTPESQQSSLQIPIITNVPAFPTEIGGNATYTWSPNQNGTYDLNFKFPNPTGKEVSLAEDIIKGEDPGTQSTTTGSSWIFIGISPTTTQYVNMKVMVDGNWSEVTSWGIKPPEKTYQNPSINDNLSYRDQFINRCNYGQVYCTCLYDQLSQVYSGPQIMNIKNNDPELMNDLAVCNDRFNTPKRNSDPIFCNPVGNSYYCNQY